MQYVMLRTAASLFAVVLGAASLGDGKPGALTSDPKGVPPRTGYFPVQIQLSPQRPSEVKREPTYKATPKYGMVRLGNGPKGRFAVAVDEPADSDWKIFVDVNGNGDLTDDGDGAWSKKNDSNGRVMYGINEYTLRASYGSTNREQSSAPYGVAMYRFSNIPYLLMYRTGARVGTIEIEGKIHKAVLIENDADALYQKPVSTVEEARKTKPVWLRIDINDDGKFASDQIDIRAPFKLGEKAYEAIVSADGSSLKLSPTTKPVLDLTPKAPPRPPLLAAGTPAPDFTAANWGGGDVKLSDYRGKTVVLDFWATWCGPCMRSMPHLQQVAKSAADQPVVFLALCVWDEKAAYEKWVTDNLSKYSFTFAYDAAGRAAGNIAQKLYSVSGIPTTYIIDKDGKVAATVVGYQDGDKRIEEALKALGIAL